MHNAPSRLKRRIQIALAIVVFPIGCASAQQVFVSSRNSHEVKLYDFAGNFIENFVEAGSGGLSFPQSFYPNRRLDGAQQHPHPGGGVCKQGAGKRKSMRGNTS